MFEEPENNFDFTVLVFLFTVLCSFNFSRVHVHALVHKHRYAYVDMNTYTTIFTCIQNGFYPLFNASQEGYDEIVQMLLQAWATVDLQNKVKGSFNFVHLSLVV